MCRASRNAHILNVRFVKAWAEFKRGRKGRQCGSRTLTESMTRIMFLSDSSAASVSGSSGGAASSARCTPSTRAHTCANAPRRLSADRCCRNTCKSTLIISLHRTTFYYTGSKARVCWREKRLSNTLFFPQIAELREPLCIFFCCPKFQLVLKVHFLFLQFKQQSL